MTCAKKIKLNLTLNPYGIYKAFFDMLQLFSEIMINFWVWRKAERV